MFVTEFYSVVLCPHYWRVFFCPIVFYYLNRSSHLYINFQPNEKILRLAKLKIFADGKVIAAWMVFFGFDRIEIL